MTMNNSFASTFAPYTPPPDEPSRKQPTASSSRTRPWFPAQESSSYQSGGLPTLGNSYGSEEPTGFGNQAEAGAAASSNQWESRFGMRVDLMAAFAYLLGPISALLCLILETHNDFVRFHAYQSAMVTTPFVLFRIFASLVGFTSWLRTTLTWLLVLFMLALAGRAYIDASRNNLRRTYLPYVGHFAEQWVSEE